MNNPFIYFLNTNGVFLMVLLALVLLYINKRDREVFWHAVFVFFISLVVSVILKQLFEEPRPFQVFGGQRNAGLALLSSFPSAHAAISFAVATIVALHRRKIGIFFLVLASLISIGRVAGGVHYPIDIGFGMLLGVTIALFFDTVHVHFKKSRFRS